MRALSRSARTVVGALVAVVVVAGGALGGALPAAGQDTAARTSPALRVTAPQADAVVHSAPIVVVRTREPVEGVSARLERDGTTLGEARQTEPSDTGAYRAGDLPLPRAGHPPGRRSGDTSPQRDLASGGPQAAPPEDSQDTAAEQTTLDVVSTGALPRPPLTPLVGVVVFVAVLFALRGRV